VSDYGLHDWGSIPGTGKEFFLCVLTDSRAQPAHCPMRTGDPFPGGKAWPGRDADHLPPSSSEVKNKQELYFLSHQAPPWRERDCFTFAVERNMQRLKSLTCFLNLCMKND
jgi:hypothetical protein